MHDWLGPDLTRALLDAAITALIGLLGFLAAWLNKHRAWLNLSADQAHATLLTTIAHAAVAAVEQVAASRGWNPDEKKSAAVNWITGILDDHGIDVTPDELDVYVERAVLELKTLLAPVLTPIALEPSVTSVTTPTPTPDAPSAPAPLVSEPLTTTAGLSAVIKPAGAKRVRPSRGKPAPPAP